MGEFTLFAHIWFRGVCIKRVWLREIRVIIIWLFWFLSSCSDCVSAHNPRCGWSTNSSKCISTVNRYVLKSISMKALSKCFWFKRVRTMSVSIDLLGSQVFQLGFQLLVSNFDYLNNDVQIGIEIEIEIQNNTQHGGFPCLIGIPLYTTTSYFFASTIKLVQFISS